MANLEHRGSAVDVLSYIPGISFREGRFMTQNETSPVVYIDDVEVSNTSELYSLRSEEISRVTYIETANSAYRSQGGGVIRIYTREQKEGLSLHAVSEASVGNRGAHGEMIKGSWRSHHLQTTATLDYKDVCEYQVQKNPVFNKILKPRISSVSPSLHLKYCFTPDNVLGFKYDVLSITKRVSYWSNAIARGVGPFDQNDTNGLEGEKEWSLDYSPRNDIRFYYHGKIGRWLLNANLGYYGDGLTIEQNQETSLDSNNSLHSQRVNGIDNDIWTERIEASVPVGYVHLRFGNELTSTQRKDSYMLRYLNEAHLGMNRKEKHFALFAVGAWNVRNMKVDAGLRYENYEVKSKRTTSNSTTTVDKCTDGYFLPHADLLLNLKQDSEVSLSYSMRVQRPTYDQLNGYTRFNQYMLFFSGNPDLKPSLHHRFGMNYRNRELCFGIKYQHIKDFLASTVTMNGKVYQMSYNNLPRADELVLSASYSPKFRNWTPIISTSLLAQNVWLQSAHKHLDDPIWYLDIHNPYSIGANSQVWIDCHYHTSGNVGSCLLGSTGEMHLGYSYHFRHLDLSVELQDILRTGRSSFHCYGSNIDYRHSTYNDTRRVALTLHYAL